MSGIYEAHFYQYCWHFGVLEYIEVFCAPGTTSIGSNAADALKEFFRKAVPLSATAIVPNLPSIGFAGPIRIRVWVGVEMYGQKYICILHIRDATPFAKGHENIIVSSQVHGPQLVIFDDYFQFTYDGERKIFLPERVA